MSTHNVTHRLYVEKLGATDIDEFVSDAGDVFYDPTEGVLKLSDGHTPGGIPTLAGIEKNLGLISEDGVFYKSVELEANKRYYSLYSDFTVAPDSEIIVDSGAEIVFDALNNLTNPTVSGSLSFGIYDTPLNVDYYAKTGTNILIGDSTTGCSLEPTQDAYGLNNIFMGIGAGRYTTSGYYNNFFGIAAGYNNTTGNSNNFLGSLAGYNNTTGGSNNFLGAYAGYSNGTGNYNNFLGYSAGYCNTTGNYNNFFGSYAGRNNTTGGSNNFLGPLAGYNNTTGSYNNFLGYSAGFSNTTGGSNNFFGYFAGLNNTTGVYNNFLGNVAGYNNTTGSYNNFFGSYAGRNNTTGGSNNFLGPLAGYNNTTGSYNNFFGSYAGGTNTTGSNNIAIGYNSGNDAVYNFGTSPASDTIVLGNNNHTAAYIKVNWTVTSDQRDKTNISSVPIGLEFVNQLNPVQYQFKNRQTNEITDTKTRYGFLAQDIQKLEGEPKVLVDETDLENLKLSESMMIPVLVNAIQELSDKVEKLSAQVASLSK